MSYKASLLAPDLLLVHALYSILVLDLRLSLWKARESASRARAVMLRTGQVLVANFRYWKMGLISA